MTFSLPASDQQPCLDVIRPKIFNKFIYYCLQTIYMLDKKRVSFIALVLIVFALSGCEIRTAGRAITLPGMGDPQYRLVSSQAQSGSIIGETSVTVQLADLDIPAGTDIVSVSFFYCKDGSAEVYEYKEWPEEAIEKKHWKQCSQWVGRPECRVYNAGDPVDPSSLQDLTCTFSGLEDGRTYDFIVNVITEETDGQPSAGELYMEEADNWIHDVKVTLDPDFSISIPGADEHGYIRGDTVTIQVDDLALYNPDAELKDVIFHICPNATEEVIRYGEHQDPDNLLVRQPCVAGWQPITSCYQDISGMPVPDVDPCTITGLKPGMMYDFVVNVRAENVSSGTDYWEAGLEEPDSWADDIRIGYEPSFRLSDISDTFTDHMTLDFDPGNLSMGVILELKDVQTYGEPVAEISHVAFYRCNNGDANVSEHAEHSVSSQNRYSLNRAEFEVCDELDLIWIDYEPPYQCHVELEKNTMYDFMAQAAVKNDLNAVWQQGQSLSGFFQSEFPNQPVPDHLDAFSCTADGNVCDYFVNNPDGTTDRYFVRSGVKYYQEDFIPNFTWDQGPPSSIEAAYCRDGICYRAGEKDGVTRFWRWDGSRFVVAASIDGPNWADAMMDLGWTPPSRITAASIDRVNQVVNFYEDNTYYTYSTATDEWTDTGQVRYVPVALDSTPGDKMRVWSSDSYWDTPISAAGEWLNNRTQLHEHDDTFYHYDLSEYWMEDERNWLDNIYVDADPDFELTGASDDGIVTSTSVTLTLENYQSRSGNPLESAKFYICEDASAQVYSYGETFSPSQEPLYSEFGILSDFDNCVDNWNNGVPVCEITDFSSSPQCTFSNLQLGQRYDFAVNLRDTEGNVELWVDEDDNWLDDVRVCQCNSTYECQPDTTGWMCNGCLYEDVSADPDYCDGLDNDCNPATPDGYAETDYGQTTTCGVGECASTGMMSCDGTELYDTCTPGTPSEEVCTGGLDEDCDGLTDLDDSEDCASYLLCEDPDSGLDFYNASTVTFQGSAYADYCSGNEIVEYYCDPDDDEAAPLTEQRPCANDCQDGACLAPTANCPDNDLDAYSGSSNTLACGPQDCDDTNFEINPSAPELCYNTLDDNCDGLYDAQDSEACPMPLCTEQHFCTDSTDNDLNTLADEDDYFCRCSRIFGNQHDLISYYPLGGPGGIAEDFVGCSTDAEIIGDVLLNQETSGREEAMFNGASMLWIKDPPAVQSSSISVAAWVMPNTFDAPAVILAQDSDTPGELSYALRLLSNNRMAFTVYTDDQSQPQSVTINIPDQYRHHYTGIYSDSVLSIYFDGILANTISASGQLRHASGDFYIGARITDSAETTGEHFSGSIDEIAVFDRALSASEIQKMHMLTSSDPFRDYCFCRDDDMDGYSPVGGICGPVDCDDSRPNVYPSWDIATVEVCGNNIDDDCDGFADGADPHGCSDIPAGCADLDSDGYPGYDAYDCPSGTDCDDLNAQIHPTALEVCNNGFDADCDGITDDYDCEILAACGDADSDKHYAISAACPMGDDCDDTDPAVRPFVAEVCSDNIDNDCDGLIDDEDEECPCTDEDNDGYYKIDPVCPGSDDCDDKRAYVNPGASEICDNNRDDNCNGIVDTAEDCIYLSNCQDSDDDGWYYDDPEDACLIGDDCDDTDSSVHPTAEEVCGNGMDDDCNGVVDDPSICELACIDFDSDGYDSCGAEGEALSGCSDPCDCDDSTAAVSPGHPEICANQVDEDCDGDVDEYNCTDCYDSDGGVDFLLQGYSLSSQFPAIELCAATPSNVLNEYYCDSGVSTLVQYTCPDGCQDGECMGAINCTDKDGDKFYAEQGCGPVDCDDKMAYVNPGAEEICGNRIDENCDGSLTIGCCVDCTPDECEPPGDTGFMCDSQGCLYIDVSDQPEDCDDNLDNNCNGLTDTADPQCLCTDSDQAAESQIYTSGSVGFKQATYDDYCSGCPAVLQGSCLTEYYCDPQDPDDQAKAITLQCPNTCENGACQEGACADEDLDGFSPDGGDCGKVDCDDGDADIFPGAEEICDDSYDNDCDSLFDSDDPDCNPACIDADGDGYSAKTADCPSGLDCDDTDPGINPGAAEMCDDSIDNDCNYLADDEDPKCICEDNDQDGFGAGAACSPPLDCDDDNLYVNPGAQEVCNDNIDNDCDSYVDTDDDDCPSVVSCSDADSDGYTDISCGGSDCDDSDALVHPFAAELCDLKDNDCDGSIDEGISCVICGDNVCNGFETSSKCPQDCTTSEGCFEYDDGVMIRDTGGDEEIFVDSCQNVQMISIASCPSGYGSSSQCDYGCITEMEGADRCAVCGDDVCEGFEPYVDCADCDGLACGDGVCSSAEDALTCPSDCTSGEICLDYGPGIFVREYQDQDIVEFELWDYCYNEYLLHEHNCPSQDYSTKTCLFGCVDDNSIDRCAVCGDSICEGLENFETCAADCPQLDLKVLSASFAALKTEDTLTEGVTKSFSLRGETYDINAQTIRTFPPDVGVQFVVDQQVSGLIAPGESYETPFGFDISVLSITAASDPEEDTVDVAVGFADVQEGEQSIVYSQVLYIDSSTITSKYSFYLDSLSSTFDLQLDPGQVLDVQTDVTVAQSGDYRAVLFIDSDDSFREMDENNNYWTDTINILCDDDCDDDGYVACLEDGGPPLGYAECDCNDTDAYVNPGADEICNQKDDNCDGDIDEEGATNCITYYLDEDRDSYGDLEDSRCLCSADAPYDTQTAGDCDDLDDDVNPGITESCDSEYGYDGIDNNCDGIADPDCADICDQDSDGYHSDTLAWYQAAYCALLGTDGGDCDDTRAAVNPGQVELCDGFDNDCDGLIDEDFAVGDTCTAGLGECKMSGNLICSDSQEDVVCDAVPGAPVQEICDNSLLDDDCDGFADYLDPDCAECYDLDNDGENGTTLTCPGGADCDDSNASINTSAPDGFPCDGIDNNCDGVADDEVIETFYLDADGDGFGDEDTVSTVCPPPDPAYVSELPEGFDCDDDDPDTYPGAQELCDGTDNDCDGTVDEDVPTVFYNDSDNDGYGNPAQSITVQQCPAPANYVANADDRCLNTPAGDAVNIYGCTVPFADSFDPDYTTDFSQIDLFNASDVYIGIGGLAQINFTEDIWTLVGAPLDQTVTIGRYGVAINTTNWYHLNVSAVITLFNITFTNPVIIMDGEECEACSRISHELPVFVFSVPHFTNFTIIPGPYCGDGSCNGDETYASCPDDCPQGTGQPPSQDGGGGGLTRRKDYCTENWVCTDWFTCRADGTQKRNCIDRNFCGTTDDKPETRQECTYTPTCWDKIQNQGETGVDCGGPCDPCVECSVDSDCAGDQECRNNNCVAKAPAPSCYDRIQNQGETGVDCGGPCKPCPSCSDEVRNQGETGVDCGGPCLPCQEPEKPQPVSRCGDGSCELTEFCWRDCKLQYTVILLVLLTLAAVAGIFIAVNMTPPRKFYRKLRKNYSLIRKKDYDEAKRMFREEVEPEYKSLSHKLDPGKPFHKRINSLFDEIEVYLAIDEAYSYLRSGGTPKGISSRLSWIQKQAEAIKKAGPADPEVYKQALEQYKYCVDKVGKK
ncbi:hypothetical protein GF351_04020 [Candidatus Woesearchaeota archaeon]|nr:hypothetical protein [Candidatus Woesearchaeota archaeon]